ncbi:MAG TPA: hypothetical protein DEQ38_01565 [Elusimicrobia bacterium]|nr:MAG: hypothetical protein A2089_10150 [Elusimicrobia bacterium GWD2_63_28]HCC46796.1 hypothetical protein [Elusimicrobiota bacterium]
MKNISYLLLFALLLPAAPAAADLDDESSFFREEARFISASLRATSAQKAPASVSVLTAAEIKASGASTLWDALRLVPGVDVAETRAGQGDVSVRGFNQSNSNRLLVLLDGKTVLQEFYGIAAWEAIPVGVEEIDRIEVVRGPASSLYGANAIHGVINIITKTPQQLSGTAVSAGGGNRSFRTGSVLYGGGSGKYAFKAGAGYRNMNRFEDGDELASRVARASASGRYEADSGASLGVSGGISRLNNQLGIYNNGVARPYLDSGHLRADYALGGFKARTFWNTSRVTMRDFWGGPDLAYDTFDLNISQELELSDSDKLAIGAGYRRNTIAADIFGSGWRSQDIASLFAENTWEPSEKWALTAGARLDRHSLSGAVISPRASLMCFPDQRNTLRLSAGAAFRNPTLIENYLDITQPLPAPLGNITFSGSRNLNPEKMESVEIAHNGVYGGLSTGLAVYVYRLKDLINTNKAQFTAFPDAAAGWTNTGTAHAFGGEASAEYLLNSGGKVFANYSYFNASESGRHNDSHNSPMHKANAGVYYSGLPLSGALWGHWAGPTWWDDATFFDDSPALRRLGSYFLLNARVSWRAGSRLELALKAFNLLDNRHYEVLPYRSSADVGQYGEIIGARYAAELSYRF